MYFNPLGFITPRRFSGCKVGPTQATDLDSSLGFWIQFCHVNPTHCAVPLSLFYFILLQKIKCGGDLRFFYSS